ncbi:hypothetical protein IQ279_25645 [Streptomyces verrucosisporus]|uniref:hypothetical protein n=1 Tax=Streptomyces verrucosisporus TaxID=1695161 RepID=UPI0019D184DA|nr:hypothetical protein [Streptomyces verrucosisporus]MBN3932949.1 hypothetical protein [Streptomyces verrucosisporus]
MELTQATVDDLLARLGPEGGYLCLPGDVDPQAQAGLLGSRYGPPPWPRDRRGPVPW